MIKGNKILLIMSLALLAVAILMHYLFSMTYIFTLPLIVLALLLFLLRDINRKNKIYKKGLLFAGCSLIVGLALSLNNSFTLPLLVIAIILFLMSLKNNQYQI